MKDKELQAAWRRTIGKLVTDRGSAVVLRRFFGGKDCVPAGVLADWVTGNSTPPNWAMKVALGLLNDGFIPAKDSWSGGIGHLLKYVDISRRLAEVGVSKVLLHHWRNGTRPPAWTIPYLEEALRRTGTVGGDRGSTKRTAAAVASGLDGPKKAIVESYFGLAGEAPMPIRQVAETVGCSPQYVHQVLKGLNLKRRARTRRVGGVNVQD